MNIPANEAETIELFRDLARWHGWSFVWQSKHSTPDALLRKGTETILVEFEYRSRNFKRHKHNPACCDLIACWRHDWPECPLPVWDLSEYALFLIERMEAQIVALAAPFQIESDALTAPFRAEIAYLRSDIADLEATSQAEIADLEAEIAMPWIRWVTLCTERIDAQWAWLERKALPILGAIAGLALLAFAAAFFVALWGQH